MFFILAFESRRSLRSSRLVIAGSRRRETRRRGEDEGILGLQSQRVPVERDLNENPEVLTVLTKTRETPNKYTPLHLILTYPGTKEETESSTLVFVEMDIQSLL